MKSERETYPIFSAVAAAAILGFTVGAVIKESRTSHHRDVMAGERFAHSGEGCTVRLRDNSSVRVTREQTHRTLSKREAMISVLRQNYACRRERMTMYPQRFDDPLERRDRRDFERTIIDTHVCRRDDRCAS